MLLADNDLRPLNKLVSLTRLTISGAVLTDNGMTYLSELPLTSLHYEGKVRGHGIAFLHRLSLVHLYTVSTVVDHHLFDHVLKLAALTSGTLRWLGYEQCESETDTTKLQKAADEVHSKCLHLASVQFSSTRPQV